MRFCAVWVVRFKVDIHTVTCKVAVSRASSLYLVRFHARLLGIFLQTFLKLLREHTCILVYALDTMRTANLLAPVAQLGITSYESLLIKD